MRHSRHWFLLPFLANMALLFSSSWLLGVISQNVVTDMVYTLPGVTMFLTIAACAMPSLAITRLLPDPSIPVTIGGLLTSAGLLWAWTDTGSAHMIIFIVLTGSGISFSLQAASVAIAPYFVRDNLTAPVGTLLLSAIIMLVAYPLMVHVNVHNNSIFLYLSPVVFISSVIPLIVYLHSKTKHYKVEEGKRLYWITNVDVSALPEVFIKIDANNDVTSSENDSQILVNTDSWSASLLSLAVWLTWGAGIDTTWLSMDWHVYNFSTSTALVSLQLLLCFVLLATKMFVEISQSSTPLHRINLASNYMQLGLLGTCGMVLYLFPEHSKPFHNYLMFTAGFALQYDDLNDLCCVRCCSFFPAVFRKKLIKCQPHVAGQEDIKCLPLLNCCSGVLHIAFLLILSLLAITLGIQIANGLCYLSSLQPLSFIFHRNSLAVMSIVAVCLSLVRPHKWLEQADHALVL